MYISFEPLELRKIFYRDDGTKGVCKLDDLSPHGYNFSICRKELITHYIAENLHKIQICLKTDLKSETGFLTITL